MHEINVVSEEPTFTFPKPLTITYSDTPSVDVKPQTITPITITYSDPFPYASDKVVPWNYDLQVKRNDEVMDLNPVGGVTRSGRNYNFEQAERMRKGKMAASNELTKPPEPEKTTVTEEEALEFLKMIKQSEYNVIEQLSKQPAKISLLSLLMNSEVHRKTLMRVLSQAFVPPSLSVDNLGGMVNSIVINSFINFNDDEIPPEGRGHVKALHISAKCKDHLIARILIDNGSSLNIMPLVTLRQLPIEAYHMGESNMVVKAFDGTRRSVVGCAEIPIQIGPCEFLIPFQVMDITASYSFLLGRPWIHMAGAIPSTLHQKVKFIVNNQLVTVNGEEDLLVTKPPTVPYVEASDISLECSFQSFEVVSIASSERPLAQPSEASVMVAKVMKGNGYQPGGGLGKYLQGAPKLISNKPVRGRFGLGYKPTEAECREEAARRKRRFRARLAGKPDIMEDMTIRPFPPSFRSAGYREEVEAQFGDLSINGIDNKGHPEGSMPRVYQGAPGERLANWACIKLPTWTT